MRAPVGSDRGLEKAQVGLGETSESRSVLWLSHDHEEATGDIVHAVAVLVSWGVAAGVFEETHVVTHAREMHERECGRALHDGDA
jgi:hypothetical protein